MIEKTVFEILIYRISEDKFCSQYKTRKEEFIRKFTTEMSSQKSIFRLENHFFQNYGGPWRYNQIVGAIKIYTLSDQIRGEFWRSTKKRYGAKMKNKNISMSGNVFEITVFNHTTNEDICNS